MDMQGLHMLPEASTGGLLGLPAIAQHQRQADQLTLRDLPSGPCGVLHWKSLKSISEELFQHFFTLPCSNAAPQTPDVPSTFDFLWMLFLCAKQALLPPQPDLASAYALLLACINALLASTPPRAPCLRVAFSNTRQFPRRTTCGAADTLHTLIATAPQLNERFPATVFKLVPPLDAFLEDMLAPAGLVACSAVETHSRVPSVERASSSSRVYVGLVMPNGDICPAAAAALEAFYERAVKFAVLKEQAAALIDEELVATPMSEPGSARSTPPPSSAVFGRWTAGVSPAADPLVALRWLEDAVENADSDCISRVVGPEEGNRIDTFAEQIVEAAWAPQDGSPQDSTLKMQANDHHHHHNNKAGTVLLDAASNGDPNTGKHQTLALFSRSLAALLASESARLGASDAAWEAVVRISRSDAFLRGVIACSLECVAAAHSMEHMAFPTVLGLLTLDPFDLSKIIAAFVKAEPDMPRAVKKHLFTVEERIIGDLAWRHGSSLFTALSAAAPEPSMNTNTAGNGHLLSSSRNDRSNRNSTNSSTAPRSLGTSPREGADPSSHAVASALVNKALKIAFLRLRDLTARLELGAASSHILQQAYTAVRYIAAEHTWLMYGRALDHILLCTLYGVCKANRIGSATFKAIIIAYKAQPHASQETIRSVSTAGPPPESPAPSPSTPADRGNGAVDDVIAFYNKIFLPETTALLQGIAAGAVHLLEPPGFAIAGEQRASQYGTSGHTPVPARLRTGFTPALSPHAHGHANFQSPTGARMNTHLQLPAAVKLSPGRWVVSPTGTRMVTPPNPSAEAVAPLTGYSPRGRKSKGRGNKGTTPATTTMPPPRAKRVKSSPASNPKESGKQHPGSPSPTDALLAVVANAEDELLKGVKRGSGSDGAGDGGGGGSGLPVRDLGAFFADAAAQ